MFKNERPNNRFRVVLDVPDDRCYKSDIFIQREVIRWKEEMYVPHPGRLAVTYLELNYLNRYLKPTATFKLALEIVRGSELKINLASDYARVALNLSKYAPGECQSIIIEGKVPTHPLTCVCSKVHSLAHKEHPKVVIKMIFGDPLPVSTFFRWWCRIYWGPHSQLQTVVRLLSTRTSSTLASKVDFLEKVDRVITFTGFIVGLGEAAGEVFIQHTEVSVHK